jgi:hypothetical protein
MLIRLESFFGLRTPNRFLVRGLTMQMIDYIWVPDMNLVPILF